MDNALDRWLKANRYTNRSFAALAGLTPHTVGKLRKFKRVCTMETRDKIVVATCGKVTRSQIDAICDETRRREEIKDLCKEGTL